MKELKWIATIAAGMSIGFGAVLLHLNENVARPVPMYEEPDRSYIICHVAPVQPELEETVHIALQSANAHDEGQADREEQNQEQQNQEQTEMYSLHDAGEFRITFYCACDKCTGKNPWDAGYGVTASGTIVREGRTIAVDPELIGLGSEVYIEGFGWYTAEDTGKEIKRNSIDIYMDDHDECLECGVQYAQVYVRTGGTNE